MRIHAWRGHLFSVLALVAGLASEDSSPYADTCSERPASASSSALLQVASAFRGRRPEETTIKHIDEDKSTIGNQALLSTRARAEKASLGFRQLVLRGAADGFCTAHPCHAALLKSAPSFTAGVGRSAGLTQAGYQQVAAARDDLEMKDFILRVIDRYDCKVESVGALMGIVPWFSGTTLVQDFDKLQSTLLSAVLSRGRQSSWLSFKNSDHITGNTAAVDFMGYVQVAAMKNDDEMKKFVRRVCHDHGVKVLDDDGLTGMVRYYSGTDNFQSFDRLKEEVRSAANAPHSWAKWIGGKPPSDKKYPSSDGGFRALALRAEKGFCADFPCRRANAHSFLMQQRNVERESSLKGHGDNTRGLGQRVGLDQAGYEEVAAAQDDAEMTEFFRRVIEKYDCEVDDEGGLAGIVPWFSGSTAVQSLEALENTLLLSLLALNEKPWIVYKNSAQVNGDTAELNFLGYVQVAAMRDDAEMQKFAGRVCDDMRIRVLNKDGLAGVARFYSGTDSFQSYDRLRDEIKAAANIPDSWAVDESGTAEDNSSEEKQVSGTGNNAELNYAGYVQVAATRSNKEMGKFARRVCQKLHVKILDEGGFEGMVKFFVGPDYFQSYDKLATDIKSAASQPHSWCKYK